MKKFLAILLALVMVLAMVACGGEKAPATDDTAADTGATEGESFADTSTSGFGGQDEGEEISNEYSGELGMYDPNYDYNANPKYKVVYYVLATGVL